jgi:prophage tail gpP-like protein
MNIISIEVDGETYTDFVSYEITDHIENLVKSYTITMNKPESASLFTFSSLITIYIDDESILTGYIDEIKEEDSGLNSLVTLIGRDRMCDLVDSSIGAKIFKTPIEFESLVAQVLSNIGYNYSSTKKFINSKNYIQVINNYGFINTLTSEDDVVHRQSDSAFEVIKRCADIRQLILTTDGDGNFVINKINLGKTDTVLYRARNDDKSNVITSSTSTTIADRYYKYVIQSKANSSGQEAFPNITPFDLNRRVIKKGRSGIASRTLNGTAITYDDEIRETRVFTDFRQASTVSSIEKRAEWEKNVRAYKGFTYDCKVYGFRQNLENFIQLNPLWKVNYSVEVYDEVRDVYGEYLIKSITYSKTNDGGSISRLSLIDEKAYKESLFEPIVRKLIGIRQKNKNIITPFAT